MADTRATITLAADLDPSGVLSGVKAMQGAFNGLKIPDHLASNITKEFENLNKYANEFKKIMEKGPNTKGDVKALNKLEQAINNSLNNIMSAYNEIQNKPIYLEADATKIEQARQKVNDLKNEITTKLSNIKLNLDGPGGKISTSFDQIFESIDKSISRSSHLKETMASFKNEFQMGNMDGAVNQLDQLEKHAITLKGSSNNLLESFRSLGLIQFNGPAKDLTDANEKANLLATAFETIKNAVRGASPEVQKLVGDLEKAVTQQAAFEKTGLDNYRKAAVDTGSAMNQMAGGIRQATQANNQLAQSMFSTTEQVRQLQTSTQYFFSLRNMINLLKRGVQEAFNTVKELDAAMTETAVVTKFDVSDMWEKLPEYTANANALGATVQDMYKSATLYYQQGLNAQQAMSIASETMKMARIGGLEAADATDMMTAALRGFNMELSEVSAQRINDVYSNLAAKTASNTQELGEAMERTASIAHSAGMSFEGTSAFLAQMIETTREAPENLGTAMKTIIARFQELKKNPLEMQEIDGEEVSFNKVDTALQTIGVSLKDANGQFRELDQVFLDIAQRWDGLSQTQQRYIATTAAGSRQQSRFIAMMNNYDRTVQLMDYANNSAGASNEQFGKTMESLEAKLNKLTNAWQQFTMGIANNSFIKGFVDGLTSVLNTTNKVIDALSLGSGAIKSFLSIFTAFTALKFSGKMINSLIGGLGGMIDPNSTFGGGFKTGVIGRNSAQAISQPVVTELRGIRQFLGAKFGTFGTNASNKSLNPYYQYDNFKNARNQLDQFNKGGKVSDLVAELGKVPKQAQNQLMRSYSGTFYAATNSVLKRYSKGKGYEDTFAKDLKSGERFLNNARLSGELSAKEYFTALRDPALLKAALQKSGIKENNPVYGYLDNLSNQISEGVESTKVPEAQKRFDEAIDKAIEKNIKLDPNKVAKARASINKNSQGLRNQYINEQSDDSFKVSKAGQILNSIGKFGAGVTQAGMGIQAFGSILTSSANPALAMFGSALTSVGGLVSGLGMTISGLSSGISALASTSLMTQAGTALSKSAIGASLGLTEAAAASSALSAGLFALALILGVAVAAYKNHIKQIKEDAKKIQDNYTEKSQKNQSNISNLTQWKDEFPRLAKGVNEYGLNVSLDTSDYNRYLEIVDGIAEINPAIVEGYNAQGHAIINNNKALEQTLALEKERATELTNNYTDTEAWTKLLKARNLERHRYGFAGNKMNRGQQVQASNSGYELAPKYTMRTEASKLGKQLLKAQQEGLFDSTGLGVDLQGLAQGMRSEQDAFIRNYDQFKQRVNTAIDNAGEDWNERSKNSIVEGFSAYGEAKEELGELTQDLYQSMSTYAASSPLYEGLDERFKTGYQQILKGLAEDGDIETESQMRAAVDGMINDFERIGPAFNEAMQEVEIAREQYALDLNETNYSNFINQTDGPIEKLQELRKTFEDRPDGDAWVQWIDTTIDQIQNHTIEGVESIQSAFNTLSGDISSAEKAVDDFNEKTKTDYSTAAEGMKSIYDTAMTKDDSGNYTHRGFNGDNTYFTAVRELLGDYATGKTKKDIDKAMDNLGPMLEEGPEGFANFALKVRDSKDELMALAKETGAIKWDETEDFFSEIDSNKDPQIFAKIAEQLGMSEQLLVSLLNKGRQFIDLKFEDAAAVRTALAEDPHVVTGKTQTYTTEEGKTAERQVLFMTADELREAMGEAEYARRGADERKDLKEEGIYVAQEVNKITSKNIGSLLSNLDINQKQDSQSLMRDLIGKLGEKYTKEDLQSIALAAEEHRKGGALTEEEKTDWVKEYNEAYNEDVESRDYPVLAPVLSIEGLLKELVANTNKDTIEKGGLTSKMLQGEDIMHAVRGEVGKKDSLANYFSVGEDAKGNPLNETTYKKSLNELVSLQNELTNYKHELEAGKAYAEQNGMDTSLYTQELNDVNTALGGLTGAIDQGKAKFEELSKVNVPETETSGNKSTTETSSSESKTETPQSSTKETSDSSSKSDKAEKDNRNWLQKINDWYVKQQQNGIQNMNNANTTTEETQRQQQSFWKSISDFITNNPVEREKEAREEQNQNATGQTAQELRDKNKAFWDGTTVNNDQTANEQSAAAENTSNAATALNTAATQLSAAATALNGAANNLNQGNGGNGNNNKPSATTSVTNAGTGVISGITQGILQNTQATFNIETGDGEAKLQAIKQAGDEAYQATNRTSTFTIETPGAKLLNKAATSAEKLTSNAGTKNISVNTSLSGASSEQVDTLKQSVTNFEKLKKSHTVKLKTSLSGASAESIDTIISAINRFHAKTDHTVTLKTINKTINDKDATGAHNHGYAPAPPKAGSAARGSYGQIGPKGKGGMTLTGELGYEIAWIPSENRSMVLGANGPQMINLPGDAIVWTHEQSEKIMKQKSIPAGSHRKKAKAKGVNTFLNQLGKNDNNDNGSGGGGKGNKGGKSGKGGKGTKPKTDAKDTTTKQVLKVTVWWENIARRAEAIQRQADKNQKEYEKYLKNIKATLKTTGTEGQGNDFIKNTNKAIDIYTKQLNRATTDLKNFDKGTSAQQKAAKTKSTKDDKKANKSAYLTDTGGAVQISYEGKNKKGKKVTKNELVATSGYIKKQNGTYVIDYDAVKNSTKKNTKKRQALIEELNKEINDRISKKNAAEDNIQKAQEALQKFREELYNTFFAWENELTKVWNLTQKIDNLMERISRRDSMENLLKAQIQSGRGDTNGYTRQSFENFQKRLQAQQEVISERRKAIDQSRSDLALKANGQDVNQKLAAVEAKLRTNLNETEREGYEEYKKRLQEQQKVRKAAWSYLNTTTDPNDGTLKIDFNSAAFESAQLNGQITDEMGKAIQDFVKKLQDDSKNLDELYKDQTEGLAEFYETLNDLNDEWADTAEQLLDINEEASKKEVEEFEKLSDSIKQAMDDLIEEVKRKLEERRKQEENAKTERDISQKRQRLTMLRADTSGGHAVEIAQLEQEIQEAQTSYQQSLEDQLLDKLQNQADEASKQRERQIKLQEETLNSVNNIKEVEQWMAAPEQFRDQIYDRWRTKNEYDKMTEYQQIKADSEFLTFFSGMLNNRKEAASVTEAISGNLLEEAKIKEESDLQKTNDEAVKKFNTIRDSLYALAQNINKTNFGQVQTALNNANKEWDSLTDEQKSMTEYDTKDYQTRINNAKEEHDREVAEQARLAQIKAEQEAMARRKAEEEARRKAEEEARRKAEIDSYKNMYLQNKDQKNALWIGNGSAADKYYSKLAMRGNKYDTGDKYWGQLGKDSFNDFLKKGAAIGLTNAQVFTDLTHTDQFTWEKVITAAKKAGWTVPQLISLRDNSGWSKERKNNFGKAVNKVYKLPIRKNGKVQQKALKTNFLTGGIADFTGPAWLDGTPSKPELVLNAQDTKNFIALKDVLSKAVNSTGQISDSYGNATYEININVDHLNSDYDVDKVVERVKKKIVQDSGYRNVTQVRNFR